MPALAGAGAAAPLRAKPHDLDDLGSAGGSVRLRTAAASLVAAVVPDAVLPRKVVAADFNVPLDGTHRRRPHRRVRPVVDGPDGDAVSPLTAVVHPLLAAGDPLYTNGVGWAVFLIVSSRWWSSSAS